MFDEKDFKKLEALKKLLAEGSFELQGKEVPYFVSIFNSLDQLKEKMEKANEKIKNNPSAE